MRETIKAALAILAASAILWAVEPARAQVQDSGRQMMTSASEVAGYVVEARQHDHRSKVARIATSSPWTWPVRRSGCTPPSTSARL
jgi:hypothetical protein